MTRRTDDLSRDAGTSCPRPVLRARLATLTRTGQWHASSLSIWLSRPFAQIDPPSFPCLAFSVPPFKLQHRARAPSPGASSDAASPPAQHQHQLLAHTAKNEDMDDSSSAIEALDHHPQPRSRTPVESSSPLDLSSPAPASAPAALALGPADQEHPIVITSSSPPSAFKSYEGSPLPRSSSPPARDGIDEMAGAVAVGEEDGAEMPPPAASPAAETEDVSRSGEGSTSGGRQPAQKTSEQVDEDVTMEESSRRGDHSLRLGKRCMARMTRTRRKRREQNRPRARRRGD